MHATTQYKGIRAQNPHRETDSSSNSADKKAPKPFWERRGTGWGGGRTGSTESRKARPKKRGLHRRSSSDPFRKRAGEWHRKTELAVRLQRAGKPPGVLRLPNSFPSMAPARTLHRSLPESFHAIVWTQARLGPLPPEGSLRGRGDATSRLQGCENSPKWDKDPRAILNGARVEVPGSYDPRTQTQLLPPTAFPSVGHRESLLLEYSTGTSSLSFTRAK